MKQISRKKNTIANLIYQYGTLVIAIIRGIILIPLYLKLIDIKLYGAWLASGNVITWLALMDPGLNELLRQQVSKFYGQKDWDNLGKAIGTSWFLMTGFSIITLGVGYVISEFLPHLFLSEAGKIVELKLSIFVAAIGLALIFFSGSPGAVLQGLQRSERFVVIYFVASIIGIIGNVLLLFMGFGLVSIPLSTVITGAILTVGCGLDVIFISGRSIGIHLRWCNDYLNNIKGLIGATFFVQISRMLATSSDEFLVGIFLGTGAVPIVAFTNRLWGLVTESGQRISVAFMPSLAHLWGEGSHKRFVEISVQMLRVSMWVVAIGILSLLGFNSTIMKLWVGGEFFAGKLYNFFMALGVFAYVYVYAFSQVHYAANDIKGPAVVGIMQNVIRIGIILILLSTVGRIILPISTLLMSSMVYLFYFRKRFCRLSGLSYRNRTDTSTIISAVVGTGLGLFFAFIISANTWLGLGIGLSIGFVIIVGVLTVVDVVFREFISNVIGKIVRRISI